MNKMDNILEEISKCPSCRQSINEGIRKGKTIQADEKEEISTILTTHLLNKEEAITY